MLVSESGNAGLFRISCTYLAMPGSSRMAVGQSHVFPHPVGELRVLGGGGDKDQKINTFETWLVKIGSSTQILLRELLGSGLLLTHSLATE